MKPYLISFILLTLSASCLHGQDSLKNMLLHKRWYMRQVVNGNKRIDVPEDAKSHYMLFKSKYVETLGPDGEIYKSTYTVDDRTCVVTIHETKHKLRIVRVSTTEMMFYFLDDPEKTTYATKYSNVAE